MYANATWESRERDYGTAFDGDDDFLNGAAAGADAAGEGAEMGEGGVVNPIAVQVSAPATAEALRLTVRAVVPGSSGHPPVSFDLQDVRVPRTARVADIVPLVTMRLGAPGEAYAPYNFNGQVAWSPSYSVQAAVLCNGVALPPDGAVGSTQPILHAAAATSAPDNLVVVAFKMEAAATV